MMGPFSFGSDDRIVADLSDDERRVLKAFAEQLIGLSSEQAVARRLFPPAFLDDPLREAEFQEMTREPLEHAKRAALSRFIDSLTREPLTLDEEDASAWLGVFNDARLVLGTALDITDEMEHRPKEPHEPGAAEHNLYLYLSGLLEELVAVLSAKEFPENEEESWD